MEFNEKSEITVESVDQLDKNVTDGQVQIDGKEVKAKCGNEDETEQTSFLSITNEYSILNEATASTLSGDNSCEMCRNYETILTKLQDSERNLKEQLIAAQHLAERYQMELSGERLYRNEYDTKMSTLCTEAQKLAKTVEEGNSRNRDELQLVEETLETMKNNHKTKVNSLKARLQRLNNDNIALSQKYLKLCGVYRKCSAEMQAQTIELPQQVDQLQFLCLQLREELIETRAAREHLEAELKDEITMLQVQRREDEIEKERLEQALTEQVNGVSEELGLARSQLSNLHSVSEKAEELNQTIEQYRSVIEDLEKQVKSMQKEKKDLEMTLTAYKQKSTALQYELNTSETVQKDFVKLSQSLQIELEKIRQAEQEVRWQFDEDVHACNQCQISFLKTRSKLHCQHCGKIFCGTCLSLNIPSGPHSRLAKVCQVCHTLLSRDTAPFFSHSSRDSS